LVGKNTIVPPSPLQGDGGGRDHFFCYEKPGKRRQKIVVRAFFKAARRNLTIGVIRTVMIPKALITFVWSVGALARLQA
jgi:hypothetical protein